MTRLALVAVVFAAILAGCVAPRGKTVYEKAGVAEAAKQNDEAECTKASLDTAGPRTAAPLAVDREAVDRCMQARGYRVTAPK